MDINNFFEDAQVAESKLKEPSPLEEFATAVKERLEARKWKGEQVTMYAGRFQADAVDTVMVALAKKGYWVERDEKKHLTISGPITDSTSAV
jgi:hypothetical protein